MLYVPTSPILRSDAIVDLVGSADRFHSFFLAGGNNEKFMQYTKIQFAAQDGYSDEDLKSIDFIESSIGAPIFSPKFKQLVNGKYNNSLELYPCEIIKSKIVYNFYVGKIIQYENLIDVEKSRFRKLTDGRDVLMSPIYKEYVGNFFMARDSEFSHIYVCGEEFASFTRSNNLSISCKRVN